MQQKANVREKKQIIMKKVAILGSTGSIGTQALDVIERNREEFKASVLSCAKKIWLLEEQIEKFAPEAVVVAEEKDALYLARKYPHIDVSFGTYGLNAAAAGNSDIVLNSLVGMRGLVPTYYAAKAGKTIAFASKETLVAGGELIMKTAAENGAHLLPVDSEHSAIFQCLEGNEGRSVRRILLTASGGPFRGYKREQLEKVTAEQALKHPKWNMGAKISIDSATMMNKGLEVIEARWLFDIAAEKIEIVVHPQSVVHSMVEYEDTAIIAQLGMPDMRVPIAYALSYPKRLALGLRPLDPFSYASSLTFEKPDTKAFSCIRLAYDALKAGGSMTAALNAANEELVSAFLDKKILFTDIQDNIERVLNAHECRYNLSLDDILEVDRETRKKIKELLR